MEKYVVDETGERTEVILPVEEYERLLDAAEELEGAREHERVMDKIRSGEEERVPWEESKLRRRAGR